MEESHNTTALKKAYAEIILNTAKESAARVMFSDRKSARFNHELSETKDEAFRLLLRLKHMIDAKTIESDVISSRQQQKIDVLEAQLHEAEDIITDLRSEVRWVSDRLEKAKAFELQERNLVNMEEETVSVSAHKVDQEVADTCFSPKIHDVECENDQKHFEELSVVDTLMGNDVCESELDGDIRIKKLELSRNGCTQRIHALGRVVLERKSSSSANDEEQEGATEKDSEENLSLSSGNAKGDEAGTLGNTRCLVLALRASSAEVVTMPSNTLGSKKTNKSRGRRKRRFGKPKAKSVRTQSQLIKPCQSQSNVTCSTTSTSDGEDSMEMHLSVESKEVEDLTCKEFKQHLQLKRTLDSGSIIRNEKRSKNMDQTDHLVEASQESNLVSTNVEDAENKADIPESKTRIKALSRLSPRLNSSNKSNVDLASGSINQDLTSRKEDVLVSCEDEEDSVVQSTKMASSLVNLHSESKVTEAVSYQISVSPRANVNRLLKYTFQRKRKRGSSNINDDSNSLTGKHEENKVQDPIEATLSK